MQNNVIPKDLVDTAFMWGLGQIKLTQLAEMIEQNYPENEHLERLFQALVVAEDAINGYNEYCDTMLSNRY